MDLGKPVTLAAVQKYTGVRDPFIMLHVISTPVFQNGPYRASLSLHLLAYLKSSSTYVGKKTISSAVVAG